MIDFRCFVNMSLNRLKEQSYNFNICSRFEESHIALTSGILCTIYDEKVYKYLIEIDLIDGKRFFVFSRLKDVKKFVWDIYTGKKVELLNRMIEIIEI